MIVGSFIFFLALFLVSGLSVVSGLGTAAVVGLFFGFQPAHQASRLDPIAGLQGP